MTSSIHSPYLRSIFFSLLLVISCHVLTVAQTGSEHEPIRYIGGKHIDPFKHEAGLRYAIGVENIQTFRANRSHPELADNFGYTYSHASNLAYWNGMFYQQYISGESDEHVAPVQTMLTTSTDGRDWSFPQVIFPAYEAPEGVEIPEGSHGYMMHQRMGFYVAPNGRLLTLAFYGHTDNPFRENGIGRVVRELYKDGTMGPIYFIRYDSMTDWNETNTAFPFYQNATDKGFLEACESLLADPLMTLQWYEEDNGDDGFYAFKKSEQAFNWYHRNDGKIVGLWKKSYAALSEDGGHTFSDPVKVPTFVMSGGKVWGQRTEDGKYAISYNPIDQTQYRFPMAINTSNDGILYDNLLLVQAEVPARRFTGRWKDFGPCYMRGISPGNGNPPGSDMWMSYSMNKEDIWISRIPTPIKYKVEGDVKDDFDNMTTGGAIKDWNIHSPAWARIELIQENTKNKAIKLSDSDPYDYARAIRVFEEGSRVKASFKVKVLEQAEADFEIEIADQFGNRPVQLIFDLDGQIKAKDGNSLISLRPYQKGVWYTLNIEENTEGLGSYSVLVNGEKIGNDLSAAVAIKTVERISFRTGTYRDLPNRTTPNETNDPPLPGADEKQKESVYLIDNVSVSTSH
ncbi:hypothetical protein [Jiulongibacter sp. NS-SX5]|uniref:hypothetical protein n=1 Tax=Jiulongibacter sp. NS-SX5 TaxID=3463854 RepID=UPI0040586F19